ncbi:MAG: STAS domain-containing protein [Acidobacteriia bacterium]|nr:STAS domain-containing protein [Terriglobia bacterium]
MKITLQIIGEVCVLRLEGKFIVGGESVYVKDKVKNVLQMGMRNILVDFTKVPYVDSTGIGFLVSSHTAVTNAGGSFKLLGLNQRVREVLRITKLDRVFEIFDEEEAALQSFQSPSKKPRGRKTAASSDPEPTD